MNDDKYKDLIDKINMSLEENQRRLQRAKDILHSKYWYVSDEKINNLKVPPYKKIRGTWYDRREYGNPTETDEYPIIVRCFIPNGSKYKAHVAYDLGWYDDHSKTWIIHNDWDECGLGVEVLAWMIFPMIPGCFKTEKGFYDIDISKEES